MQKVKKFTKRILLSIPIIVILIMAIQIWNVPDYRGGDSRVSYSPDGIYKLDRIYPKNNQNSVRVFSLVKDKSVVAIIPTPSRDVLAIRPSWLCSKEFPDGFYRGVPCYGHKLEAGDSDIPTVSLPPSWWRQLHAWLTIRLKGLENPNFKITRVSTRYLILLQTCGHIVKPLS